MERKESVRETVRAEYGKIARQSKGQEGASCCGAQKSVDSVAMSVGYSKEELAVLPEGANLGLSCGNPTALAALKPGEVVLDLGAGAGLDVFLAASKVGPEGKAIGVDMTADMLARARTNCSEFRARTGLDNIEFRLGEIEHLPVADASVDVIISNCVINLSPDKPQVWREIARVLKPGGRVAVSDLALLAPLPETVRQSVEALVGCIAGAVLVDETREMVNTVGLVDAEFKSSPIYIDAMANWEDPLYREIASQLPSGTKPSDFVTELRVTARKPDCRIS